MMMIRVGSAAIAAVAIWASGAAAQEFPADRAAEARALAARCTEAGQRADENVARPAAQGAERIFQEWLRAEPRAVEPRVGLASVRSRCQVPFVGMMEKGALINQANELLTEALAIDSTHWGARFSLAMNHFHTPAFLGRGSDAIEHLEILLRQQGSRAEPHFANTYLFLGDMYVRAERPADAGALWRRGAALFPEHAGLKGRLEGKAEGEGGASPQSPAQGVNTADAPARPERKVLLDAVVVEAGTRMDDTRSAVALTRLDVLMTPGGTADVMSAFQTSPGATRAGEGSDLYVRGGDPAEAPVFVDGARLFYPGRYETLNGGVFGILDSNVLDQAYFSSGGFSARYGDALSGVLDVRTLGRPATRGLRLNANTVQVGTTVGLPTAANGGVWATLRASDARLMLAMHGRDGEFARSPAALEGMAGAVWAPRVGTEVKLVAMADEDAVTRVVDSHGFTGPFRSRGANRLAALSGRTLLAGDRLALRGALSASRRETHFRFGVLDRAREDRGATARVDADWSLPRGARLSAGAEAAWMRNHQSGTVPSTDQLAPGSPVHALAAVEEDGDHVGGYVEGQHAISPTLAVIAGVRADRLPGENAWSADPRLALAWRPAGPWTLRLAGGVFHQGRWRTRYRVPDAGSPAGTPARAEHAVVGAERQGDPSLKVEAYWKRYGGYVEDGEGPPITAGRAAGVDAIVRWSGERRVSGYVTYSFLDGEVTLADGRTAPSAVDVAHSLTGVARITLRPRWELGSTLRLGSGRPFTPIIRGEVGEDGRIGPIYGAPNGERLPVYSRLDARLTRYVPMRAGAGVVYLEMLNLLDRANTQGYTYAAGYSERRAVRSHFSGRTLVLGLGLPF